MITIKIEKKVPYSSLVCIAENSVSEEEYFMARDKGLLFETITSNLNRVVDTKVGEEMDNLGIKLDEEGIIIK